jgi:Flp pilus assembly protein TadD
MEARRVSSTAWGLALIFGSFPLIGRVVLGTWEFGGSAELACLLLLVGAYARFRASRAYAAKPDPATFLDHAGRLASSGRMDRAVGLLTKTIRQSPKLWQAYQYRAQLQVQSGDAAQAVRDLSEAIRLAPNEPHLYVLRSQAYAILGDEAASRSDYESASALGQSAAGGA